MAMANFEEGSWLTNLNVIKNEIRALTTDTKEIIRQMSEESGVSHEKLREDIEKVDERINLPVPLLILGKCNSGKSSLANSLLNLCKKARQLPTGKTPCTGKITVVKHGKHEGIRVEGVSDLLAALSIDVENYQNSKLSKTSLCEHIRPREKREAEKNIVSIVLTNDFLAEGFCLLDTPGYGETVQIDDDVTRFLNEQCNPIVLYVINGNDGFRPQDQKNIAGIRRKLPSVSICYVCTHNDIDEKAARMNTLASEDDFASASFCSPEQKMETVKNALLNGGYISCEDKEDHFFAISNIKIREALKKGVNDDFIRDLEKLLAILKENLKNRQLESLTLFIQTILDCHNRSFTELMTVCRDMPRDADAIRKNITDLRKMARRWHEQFTKLLTKRLNFKSIVRDGIATCKSRLSAIVDSSDSFEGVVDPSQIHVDFSNLTQEHYSTFLEIFIDRACKCFEDEVRKRIDRLNPQFRAELTFDFNAVSSERLKREFRRIYSLETERNVSKGFEVCVSLTDGTFQRLQRGIDQNVRQIMESISKPGLQHYSESLELYRDDPKSWQLRSAEKLLETLESSRLAEKLRSHMLGEIEIIWDKLAASLSESNFSDSTWRSRRQEHFEKYNASLSVLSARGLSVNFALESCKLDAVVNAHQEQGDSEDGWRRLCTHITKQCGGHSKVREMKKVHENDVEEQAIQLIYAKDNFPVDHENVLKLRGWLMPCSNRIEVITGYFDCDLLEMVAAADDLHSRIAIARDVAQGMEAMHSVGYIHSDLKPENIKVAGQRGKISIDCISDPLGTTRLGPPFHVCAEQYENHGRWHSLQKEFFDIFAFGMLLWFLIHGKAARPIEYEHCSDNDDMRAAICRGITPGTMRLDRKSKPLWNLLKDCWTRYKNVNTINARIARGKLDEFLNSR